MSGIQSTHRHLHRRALTASMLACLVAAVCPGPGRAQTAAVPSTLAGSWAFDGTPARATAIVDAAFTPGVSTLPSLFQGLAWDRIHSSMVPPRRITIALTGSRIQVTLESSATRVIEGALGARATTTTGVTSGTTVTSGLSSGWLQLTYDGEGGMTQLFSTEPDGSRMHVDYTVTSDRLPDPVRYRLDFVRRAP